MCGPREADVAQIFGRHQHPVRLELANASDSTSCPTAQIADRADLDAGWIDSLRVGNVSSTVGQTTRHACPARQAPEPDQIASSRTAAWWSVRRVRRQEDAHQPSAESSVASSWRASSSDSPSISASSAAYSSGSIRPVAPSRSGSPDPASVRVPEYTSSIEARRRSSPECEATAARRAASGRPGRRSCPEHETAGRSSNSAQMRASCASVSVIDSA